ncbi:src-like-adapter 2 [Lepisosteus oculatus]|uniref:Src like adaptor 2b n=1 Tax=Lepisosteus oculatus TaxID=7918 RepID=W5M9F6_LEPOC|nr:PREDICTED: src-like-adapter 2 [Lepisosteus oculatus]
MGSRPSKGRRNSSQQANLSNQQEPPQAAARDPNKYVVVALYNYPSGGPGDCSIRVGERLNILSEEGDWWRVSSTATGKESYIPSNYTAKVFHRWLFEGISREKAEELLLLPYNQAGSFMIRESQSQRGAFALSVRRSTTSSWDSVKHYRIRRLENGWFYISPRLTFASLIQLVDHYSESGEGLCCMLREPCYIQGSNNVPVLTGPPPTAVRKPTLNWKDVDRSMLFSNDKDTTEESLVSEGLREAINSYLYMTEEMGCVDCIDSWKT